MHNFEFRPLLTCHKVFEVWCTVHHSAPNFDDHVASQERSKFKIKNWNEKLTYINIYIVLTVENDT